MLDQEEWIVALLILEAGFRAAVLVGVELVRFSCPLLSFVGVVESFRETFEESSSRTSFVVFLLNQVFMEMSGDRL